MSKRYFLKFLRDNCNRTREIKTLTTYFNVVKMPLITFPKYVEENTSIYELIFNEEISEEEKEKINDYFYKNNTVKEITEKTLSDYLNPDFIYPSEKRKQEELEAKMQNKIKK